MSRLVILLIALALSTPDVSAQTQAGSIQASTAPMAVSAGTNGVSEPSPKCMQKFIQMKTAIQKFEQMGVGIAPFEALLNSAQTQISSGEFDAATATLDRLERSLTDQQKRFYTNKWNVWHGQRMSLTGVAGKKRRAQAIAQSSGSSNKQMSGSVRSTLAGKDTKYQPLIYPIAR